MLLSLADDGILQFFRRSRLEHEVRPQLGLSLVELVEGFVGAGAGSGVDDVTPVALRAGGQLFPTFDQEDASVADLAAALFGQLEALDEVVFIPFAVGEAAAAAFCFANAATHC